MAQSKPVKKRKQLKAKRQEKQKQANHNKWLRIGGVVFLVVVVLLAIGVWRSNATTTNENQITAVSPNLDGSINAPVQIVEYGDFGCHACQAWHNAGVKAQLQQVYGEQISFEFRHFPVITNQSPKAAEASQCAADQDAFWPYHDILYEQAGSGQLQIENLKMFAGILELDQTTFDQCLDTGQYRGLVSQHQQAALNAGARGTPSFYVNGEAVISPSYQTLSSVVEGQLAN